MAQAAKKNAEPSADPSKPEMEVVKRPLVQLSTARFKQAEFVYNIFAVKATDGTTVEDLLDERYWAHVANMLKPDDWIVVQPDDRSWLAELLVLSAGKLYAQVHLLHKHEIGEIKELPNASPYAIDYGGGTAKWRVTRDGDVIRDGFDSKRDAARWVRSHEEALDR